MTCDQILDKDRAFDAEMFALDARIFRLLHGALVEDFIHRNNVGVPNTFVPSATGFAVTECICLLRLLYLAHPKGMYGHSPRWRWIGGERKHLYWTYTFDDHSYSLRGYGCTSDGYEQLWAIEKEREGFGESKVHNVLALDSTPILLTDPKIAKLVAQLCHPNPPEEANSPRWIPITT